jgi:hypothetical protein
MTEHAPSARTRAAFRAWVAAVNQDGTSLPMALSCALLGACEGDVDRAVREIHVTQHAVVKPAHPLLGGSLWSGAPMRPGQLGLPSYFAPMALLGRTIVRGLTFTSPEPPHLIDVSGPVFATGAKEIVLFKPGG